MRTRELASVHETVADYEKMEQEILRLFRDEIYLPLITALDVPKDVVIENATDDLRRAIQRGRVRFYRGRFSGKFTANISKELRTLGATWEASTKSWKLLSSDLTDEIRLAVDASDEKMKRTEARVLGKLADINPDDVAEKFQGKKLFDHVLWKTDRKVTAQVEAVTVAPKLSKESRAKIAEEYTQNLRIYIKKWTEEEIVKLRERVEKSAVSGARYETLVSTIQKSYGVSQNKAKFLARQETSLLMAKFKETRYRDAGSTEYIWRCVAGSPNHPVRPFHKKLDGTRQRWDSPPIIDKNGNRKHPGEDYGCRCTARPLVKF